MAEPNFARDIDIGYARAPIDVVISLIGTVIVTLNASIEVAKENTADLWEEMVTAREWSTILNDNIVDKLEHIRVEAGVNVVTELLTFHDEFASLIAALPSVDTIISELIALREANVNKGDDIIAELQTDREWDTVIADQLIEKLETIRLANVATESGVTAKLDETSAAAIAAAGDVATLIINAMVSEITAARTEIDEAIDAAVAELERIRKANELILGEEV